MAPRREKSSTLPQQPAKTEPAPKSTHSAPAHLRPGAKVAKGGPGQTWLNFTKKDVDDYLRSHQESQDKGTRMSLLGKLSGFIRRAVRRS
jgi:hypothetical protein